MNLRSPGSFVKVGRKSGEVRYLSRYVPKGTNEALIRVVNMRSKFQNSRAVGRILEALFK